MQTSVKLFWYLTLNVIWSAATSWNRRPTLGFWGFVRLLAGLLRKNVKSIFWCCSVTRGKSRNLKNDFVTLWGRSFFIFLPISSVVMHHRHHHSFVFSITKTRLFPLPHLHLIPRLLRVLPSPLPSLHLYMLTSHCPQSLSLPTYTHHFTSLASLHIPALGFSFHTASLSIPSTLSTPPLLSSCTNLSTPGANLCLFIPEYVYVLAQMQIEKSCSWKKP